MKLHETHKNARARVQHRLAVGFFLVISLGLLGYLGTVQTLRQIESRNRATNHVIAACILHTKDAALAARDMSACAANYVYSGEDEYWEDKWVANANASLAFGDLDASLKKLPHSQDIALLAQNVERQNFGVCDPQENQAMALVRRGNVRAARWLTISQGVADRDRLDFEVDDLVTHLQRCQQNAEALETARVHHTILAGWAVQALLLCFSLIIAFSISRQTAAGVALLQEAEASSRRSEERYRLLVEASPEAIVVYCEDHVVYANPSARALLGAAAEEELVGKCVFDFIHPDSLAAVQERVRRCQQDREASALAEVKYVRRDGQPILVEAVSCPISWENKPAGQVIARDITERKRLENELAFQAFHDSLTGLPNRSLFHDRLRQAMTRARRLQACVAVLFVDLDNFKVVNDSLGHQAGDALLVAVAQRLGDCVRPGDTLARLGGDEFTLLLEDIPSVEVAASVASRIAEQLAAPVEINNRLLHVTASVGVALAREEEVADLLREADIAMYQAKNGGKSRFVVFDRQMSAQAQERLEMESELRRAICGTGLVIHYQPIVSMQSGALLEMEALVRWEHPERGLVPPAKFIPLAEETGLILPLGEWVLREACRQTRQWQREYRLAEPLTVGVNLSPRQIEQEEFIEIVKNVLEETGLPPSCLKFEITETALMGNPEAATELLQRLRALGTQLAIDDFGTGYSSMSYLSAFPADTLKIDRSFIQKVNEPDGEAIVQAIVSLAKSLGMQVTCEGIETQQQREQLLQMGGHFGQGYLFSRPLTGEGMEALLADRAQQETVAAAQNDLACC